MKRSVLITMFLFTLSACELFTPREPDPPINISDPYAWRPPTSPEIVLENLANAFPAHKINYFLDVLSQNEEPGPGFTFIADPGVASSQPGVFDVWGYTEEEKFITQLFQILSEDGFQRLDWLEDQLNPDGDHFEIVANYQLSLAYSEDGSSLPSLLKGQATLTIIQNADLLYEISSWQDFAADSLASWTELKALVQ